MPITRYDSIIYSNYKTYNIQAVDHSADELLHVLVFPQPARDLLNISLPSGLRATCTLKNSLGIEMKRFVIDGTGTTGVASYPEGIYFLELDFQGKTFIKKIILE